MSNCNVIGIYPAFLYSHAVFVKGVFVFDLLYLCSLFCAPGDPGEGAWYHSRWKLRFGLWPPIRTHCLPCRVRGDHASLNVWTIWLINTLCVGCSLIISACHTCSVCKASVCVIVILAAQSVSNRRSGVCFHHRKLFFFYPWGVSFETLCNTLLWWIPHSLIHSVQTVTLSRSILICRGTAAAPLASLGASTKTSAQALFDYGNNLSKSCMLREDRLWGVCSVHLFCYINVSAQMQTLLRTYATADYMSCRLALCVAPLVLRSLANHLPPQFKSVQAVVPGADPVFLARRERSGSSQTGRLLLLLLLLREIQRSFIREEWRVGAGKMFQYRGGVRVQERWVAAASASEAAL